MTDNACCEPYRHALQAVLADRRSVEERYIDTLRAFEDHEASAHPIRPPRRWEPANYDGEPWPSGVVTTFYTTDNGGAV